MDEYPPRPLRQRQPQRPASPEQNPSNPIGGMLGCLAAGAWCLLFAWFLKPTGGMLWVVGGLGFVLVTLGLILAGVSVGEALTGRRHD